MGSAMLSAWVTHDLCQNIYVVDPHGLPAPLQKNLIIQSVDYSSLKDKHIDIIILAVKPQAMASVCKSLCTIIPNGVVVLSIAAGQSLSSLENMLSDDTPIIRAMPNTPAAIGKGVSVCISNNHINDAQIEIASALLEKNGIVEWVDDESLMDAVTALSGSGPAYIFHMIEVLAQVGEDIGLKKELAMILARQTVIGSAALAESETTLPASKLRENVTSPNGTTHAALKILMDGRIQDIYKEALLSARERSKELNSNN